MYHVIDLLHCQLDWILEDSLLGKSVRAEREECLLRTPKTKFLA